MCGRFGMYKKVEELLAEFDIDECGDGVEDFEPSYNIAPTQLTPVIVSDNGTLKMELIKWGFKVHWSSASDKSEHHAPAYKQVINARCESLQQKKLFKKLIEGKSCLIPANGYYEWKKEGSQKQPYFIKLPKDQILLLAGLWREVHHHTGEIEKEYTIITTPANEELQKIHDRMPVIIDKKEINGWLKKNPEKLELIKNNTELLYYPVSSMVNSIKNNSPKCIQESKLPPPKQPMLFEI